MYVNEFKTKENKISTKDEIEPRHIHWHYHYRQTFDYIFLAHKHILIIL